MCGRRRRVCKKTCMDKRSHDTNIRASMTSVDDEECSVLHAVMNLLAYYLLSAIFVRDERNVKEKRSLLN